MADRVYTSREEIEVHRFSPLATIGIPLLALFLQASLPVRMRWFAIFDLPLIVTIFFAVARRSPVKGLLTGAIIGILQDALAGHPIGIFGIAKTAVGYLASSIGVKVDVENPGSRLLMTFGFYIVHQALFMLIATQLVQQAHEWRWGHMLVGGVANALLAVVLFAFMDRAKLRA